MTREQAAILTTALTVLPYAQLRYDHGYNQWYLEYGEKGNLHSNFVGPDLALLCEALTQREWGGWTS